MLKQVWHTYFLAGVFHVDESARIPTHPVLCGGGLSFLRFDHDPNTHPHSKIRLLETKCGTTRRAAEVEHKRTLQLDRFYRDTSCAYLATCVPASPQYSKDRNLKRLGKGTTATQSRARDAYDLQSVSP